MERSTFTVDRFVILGAVEIYLDRRGRSSTELSRSL